MKVVDVDKYINQSTFLHAAKLQDNNFVRFNGRRINVDDPRCDLKSVSSRISSVGRAHDS